MSWFYQPLLPAAAEIEAAPPPPGGQIYINYWNGAQWLPKPVFYWSGSAWVTITNELKYWNGSSWIQVV